MSVQQNLNIAFRKKTDKLLEQQKKAEEIMSKKDVEMQLLEKSLREKSNDYETSRQNTTKAQLQTTESLALSDDSRQKKEEVFMN